MQTDEVRLSKLQSDDHSFDRVANTSIIHAAKETKLFEEHVKLFRGAQHRMSLLESMRRCTLSRLPKDCTRIFFFKHRLEHVRTAQLLAAFRLYDAEDQTMFTEWCEKQTKAVREEVQAYFCALQFHTVGRCCAGACLLNYDSLVHRLWRLHAALSFCTTQLSSLLSADSK
jgi:hypothetical protein